MPIFIYEGLYTIAELKMEPGTHKKMICRQPTPLLSIRNLPQDPHLHFLAVHCLG